MRKFLASVGNAKLLGKVGNTYQHIADIRTLTESTLSFSTTMEEVRAGQGAQLYGRFAHDSGMTITLTDAMFDINYVGLQVGAALDQLETGSGLFSEESKKLGSERTVTLSKNPAEIGKACNLDHKLVWIRKTGCGTKGSEWVAFEINSTNYDSSTKVLTVPQSINGITFAENDDVCIQYFVDGANTMIQVRSNFFPAELMLILTTNLFAGDANHPETGKPVGSITVKVPRFQLDGQFDLSMAMSSAATVSLNGTALAVDDSGCSETGIYAEIVEIIDGQNILDILQDIIIDTDGAEVGDKPAVYAKTTNGITLLDPSNYDVYGTVTSTFTKSATGVYVAGINYVVVYDNTKTAPTLTAAPENGWSTDRTYYAEATPNAITA